MRVVAWAIISFPEGPFGFGFEAQASWATIGYTTTFFTRLELSISSSWIRIYISMALYVLNYLSSSYASTTWSAAPLFIFLRRFSLSYKINKARELQSSWKQPLVEWPHLLGINHRYIFVPLGVNLPIVKAINTCLLSVFFWPIRIRSQRSCCGYESWWWLKIGCWQTTWRYYLSASESYDRFLTKLYVGM